MVNCPYCHEIHPQTALYCPNTGKKLRHLPARTGQTPASSTWVVFTLIGLAVVFTLLASLLLVLSRDQIAAWLLGDSAAPPNEEESQAFASQTQDPRGPMPGTGTADPIETALQLPSPLEAVPFPDQPAAYPPDWPDELRFPAEFSLVDARSGTLPANQKAGWSTKLRFQGGAEDAAEQLAAFFRDRGWEIHDTTRVDSGGLVFLVTRGEGSGVIVTDPEVGVPDSALILVTVFE